MTCEDNNKKQTKLYIPIKTVCQFLLQFDLKHSATWSRYTHFQSRMCKAELSDGDSALQCTVIS